MKYSILILLLALSGCSGGLVQKQAGQQKPNVIIILTDDQVYANVGLNGCTDIPTPNLDRIAKNGAVFSAGYVSYAVCGPSRAGLLTGRYQDRFGFSKNPLLAPNDPNMGLPLSEQTIADLLKEQGYATGIMGKWHMGAHESLHPNRRGFDEFFGFLEGGHRYFPEDWVLENIHQAKSQYDGYKTKMLRNSTPVEEAEYLTDALSREAVSFVDRHAKEPFFLYLAYNAPHSPMQATEKYLSRFPHIQDEKRRMYAAMVSAVDDGVGALLDLLEARGLAENTLVFFLSDNGGPTKDNASDNRPLRGFKRDFFEGGVRVPFALQWKGTVPAGVVYPHPIISLDIFSTAAALANATPKNELDGVNLIPFLTGRQAGVPHQALYWRNVSAGRFAIRTAESKLITTASNDMLFDIVQDISEKNNHAPDRPQQVQQLKNTLEDWKKGLKEPVFMGLEQDSEYSKLHPDRFREKP